MTGQLSPADFGATGGQPQLTGASYPNAFSSNLVGGYKHRRTYKKFMKGRKSYKKGVRKYLSSATSPGIFSRLIRKFKGKSKRSRK
jgi:hypothetical protein